MLSLRIFDSGKGASGLGPAPSTAQSPSHLHSRAKSPLWGGAWASPVRVEAPKGPGSHLCSRVPRPGFGPSQTAGEGWGPWFARKGSRSKCVGGRAPH